jgi:hypothetical protein
VLELSCLMSGEIELMNENKDKFKELELEIEKLQDHLKRLENFVSITPRKSVKPEPVNFKLPQFAIN